jgi:hypothetical protein
MINDEYYVLVFEFQLTEKYDKNYINYFITNKQSELIIQVFKALYL